MTLTLFTDPAPPAHVQPEILDRTPRALAVEAATPLHRALLPACSQIVVAGSVRRGKSHVKDIEYVAVERRPGAAREALFNYCFANKLSPNAFFGKFKNGKKQIKAHLQHQDRRLTFELYLTTPTQFGWIHYIRTGPLDWNMATMMQLGRTGFEMRDGLVIHQQTRSVMDCSDEKTIFKLLGIEYVEPRFRFGEHILYDALVAAGQTPKFTPK